jgi:hypothetical protein
MDKFPLPSLSQSNFTEYYDKEIPRRDNMLEKIVYPGQALTVTTKVRNLKKIVKSNNVFITVMDDGTFNHRLLGSDGSYTILPKRLHSVCFPKIHLGSIPSGNRITVKISPSITVNLPFVPDDFYKQKQNKSERPNKPITRNRGVKRGRDKKSIVKTDDNIEYKGWNIYNDTNMARISKHDIMSAIHYCIDSADKENIILPDPFENIDTLEENKEMFNTILQFIYHYGREEYGFHKQDNTTDYKNLWENLKN